MNNYLAGALTPSGISNPVLKGTIIEALTQNQGTSVIGALISSLVTLMLIVGVIIFFFMLIMGAISWIASGGDKGALEAAKGKITNALIGIVLLFSTFAIIKLIETFFGIKILTLDLTSLAIQ